MSCNATVQLMRDPDAKSKDGSLIQRAVESRNPTLATQALDEIAGLLDRTTDANERQYLLFSRSSCYGVLGDFAKARDSLSVALHEDPESPETKVTYDFMQGLIYLGEKNHKAAFETFTSGLSKHHTILKTPEFRFMYEDVQQRRAFLAVTLEQFETAIPLLKESLSFGLEESVRGDALAGLGLCYLECRDFEAAKENLVASLEHGLEEYAHQIHFYLGIAFYHCQMPHEAKREFLKCEEDSYQDGPPLRNVYGWLSSTCKMLGQTAESERYSRLAKPD